MTTVTTRIDEETQSRLDQLAKATDRSRSWLVADAIRRYVEEEGWQVAAIEEVCAKPMPVILLPKMK